ncbi:MAG: restriction endonuclease subunit S [Actinobacteria bacterium]|nr:restriction endonuclease subunit S [Actinomycetota bacterium]
MIRRSELTDRPQRAESLDTYKICRKNDIVFNKMSIRSGAMGVAPEDGLVTYHYEVMRPRPETSPQYIAYLMKSAWFTAELIKRERGIGAGDQASVRTTEVPFSVLKYIDCYFPPLDEQRAIADYLDRETARIDTLIEEQQRLIEMLQERRQAVIESAAGRGIDAAASMKSSGLSWIDKVPDHWVVANIRRFASMKTGHTPSRNNPDYWVDCTIPWFTLADVWQLRDGKRTYLGETESKISELGLANSAADLLPAETVVLSRTASVGFTGVMPEPMATSQDFWNWVPGGQLDSVYLMWVFRAMRSEFQALMIGSTHKTIYQPTAAAIRIPVPPMDEQRRIAAYLDEQTAKIDTLIAETEMFIELSRERRAALITAAVTGQIDVRGAA